VLHSNGVRLGLQLSTRTGDHPLAEWREPHVRRRSGTRGGPVTELGTYSMRRLLVCSGVLRERKSQRKGRGNFPSVETPTSHPDSFPPTGVPGTIPSTRRGCCADRQSRRWPPYESSPHPIWHLLHSSAVAALPRSKPDCQPPARCALSDEILPVRHRAHLSPPTLDASPVPHRKSGSRTPPRS
jgi:hypothetical protein